MESAIRFKVYPIKVYTFPMAGSEFTLNFLTVKAKWKHLINFTIKSVPTIKTEKLKSTILLGPKSRKVFFLKGLYGNKNSQVSPLFKKKKKNTHTQHPAFLTTFLLLFL